MEAVNPATGKTIKTYEEMTPAEVEKIIVQSHEAHLAWKRTDFAHRAGLRLRHPARLGVRSSPRPAPPLCDGPER